MILSMQHQQQCVTRPVYSSMVTGGIITGISAFSQGVGPHLMPQFAQNVGMIYGYHVLQCPMEALHGRQSAWHNVIAAGGIGAFGVATNRLGIPLVDYTFFIRYPQVKPVQAGFVVYGAGAGLLANVLGGKPF